MRARGWVLALLAIGGFTAIAAAEPKPKPVDIKPFRDQLIVLKDAEGGSYAVLHAKRSRDSRIFYGKGKVLHQQILDSGRSRNGTAWSMSVWAPRLGYPFMGTLEFEKDGSYRMSCGNEYERGLSRVTGDEATAILDKRQFMTAHILRRPYLLARDDRGVYYYVDVLTKEHGGEGHRVFIGKKGAMKQVALNDIASDTGGDVFATKSGDLRLVRTVEAGKPKPTATWVRGQRRSELVWLDTYMNQQMIFRDLGIYKTQGMLCDNM